MNTLIMIPSMLFYQNAERTKYMRAKWIPNMANLNLLDEVSLTKYWNKLQIISVFLKKMDLLLSFEVKIIQSHLYVISFLITLYMISTVC